MQGVTCGNCLCLWSLTWKKGAGTEPVALPEPQTMPRAAPGLGDAAGTIPSTPIPSWGGSEQGPKKKMGWKGVAGHEGWLQSIQQRVWGLASSTHGDLKRGRSRSSCPRLLLWVKARREPPSSEVMQGPEPTPG